MLNLIMSNKGSAILIVLGLIVMLTGVALVAVERANTDMELSGNQADEVKAFYVAESGLARSLVEINNNYSWRSGYYKQILEGGNYTVRVIDSGDNPALKDTVILESKGYFIGSVALLESWLVQGNTSPYQHAAFGDKRLFIQNNSCTDSYNSDSGTYAATADSVGGDVGSNVKVDLQNLPVIGGNVSSAVPGSITIINSPTIVGDTTTHADVQPMNLVSDADYAWAKAHNSFPSGLIGTGYTYSSGNLTIKKDKVVTLKSGTYYLGGLELLNHAQLQVQPGAKVKIFMESDFIIQNLALVNSTGVPSQLQIFTKGSEINFKNNTEFNGTIYASECDFLHQNNAIIRGAVIAKTVELKNNACIHYDRALANMPGTSPGDFVQVAWRQAE